MAGLLDAYHRWRRKHFAASKDDLAWRHEETGARLAAIERRLEYINVTLSFLATQICDDRRDFGQSADPQPVEAALAGPGNRRPATSGRSAFLSNEEGVGNRIKALISASSFTHEIFLKDNVLNLLFKQQWPVTGVMPASCIDFSSWRLPANEWDLKWSIESPFIDPNDAAGCFIDYEYFRIPPKIREKFLRIFLSLQFSPVVEDAVQKFTADWRHDVIGVHARSWADDAQRRNLFDIDAFFREIDRRNSSFGIFLATDSLDVARAFAQRYGDRLLREPFGRLSSDAHIVGSGSEEVAIRAFCDMICLSKAEILIGSYLSTFTECAWWFGGCKQHLIIL